ncbi:MAG: hypothetical protein PUP91_24515 [Rhizonema sp. PD37]|nr:hypothetical protein [Rhizonema sp. PD37]
MATDNLNGGNSSTSGNGDSVLKDSPWGRLSEVTSLDNVSAGFASATGNQSGGAGQANSSSGDSPYGGNPFANFGNPNASGNVFTGGTNPWASLNNSGGGDNTGSSPVSGISSSGSNPFGGGSSFSADTSGGSAGSFGGGNTGSSPVSDISSSGSNPFGGGSSFSADTSGGSAGGFGGGSTSSSGSANFGGIDFGSASQSVSFQDRVQTDQLVNSSLSENGVSVPTSVFSSGSSNPFDPGFNPSNSGSNSSGSSPVIASPMDAGNSGGGSSVGGSNSSGSNPFGSGNNGDGVAQVSPFDQLEQNLNDYFKPFSNGGTPDASEFGDPGKINPFNANLSGSSSPVSSDVSADDTRNSLLSSIDTTNTDTLGAQIEDKVVSLANSSNTTPTVGGNAPIAVDNTPSGNDSVFPQLASSDDSNLAQTSPIADTSNQSNDGSSTNAGDKNPSLDDFNNFLSAAQSGDDSLIGSSIPDGTPSFVADAIKANASTIANTIGQNQGSNFTAGGSNDGNSVFAGGSQNTQDYPAQVTYYQGLTSQFQQNPQDAAQTFLGDNQSSGGSNPFGGSGSNPFGGGGSPFGA